MSETSKQPPPVVQLADAIFKRCVLKECDSLWFDRAKAVGMIEVHTEAALAAATKRAEDAEEQVKQWQKIEDELCKEVAGCRDLIATQRTRIAAAEQENARLRELLNNKEDK